MTNDEIWEWMQRDLDGDLSSGEKQMLYSLLQKDPDLQLKYNRLKNVSKQLEQLPPVVPSFSIVDSILPRLESAAAMPVAKSILNEEILPTLEVKHKSSSPVTSKKWKRTKVWLASIGSTAAAACLMIGMLFTGSDGKNHEIADSNQGSMIAPPPIVENTAFIGPPAPTPSTNTSQSITAEDEKKPAKQPAKKQSSKPPANQTTQKQDTKQNVKPADNKPKAPPTPVRQEEKPPAFPIGLKDNPDREDKTSAKDDKDNDGDKSKSNKNKDKKDKKDDDDDDDDDND